MGCAHGRGTFVRPGRSAILTCKSTICRLRLFSRSLIKMFNILIKDQYENYSKWKISSELKQFGALVIHGNTEHSENTLRLQPDWPKVSRLILVVLEGEQEVC